MRNYSRQREAILEVLRSTKTHPSASAIYEEVRKKIPNISLGTVYRNLSALQESGEITNVWLGDGTDRFDGDISPHLHLCCKKCGSISDLPIDNDFGVSLADKCGFKPDKSVYLIYGICKNCADK